MMHKQELTNHEFRFTLHNIMSKKSTKLTTAQFANLHAVNKRTLHYYDSVGLFSPNTKGTNKYRYYDSSQSIDFEYILMLKELNMSIQEIQHYVHHPSSEAFISIADKKTAEIEQQIKKLQHTKQLLQTKKEQLLLCREYEHMSVQIIECEKESYLTAPLKLKDDDFKELFDYVKQLWGIEQCRAGIGSYISLDKVRNHDFSEYDGLFTPALNSCKKNAYINPKGKYLCGYFKGIWDDLPKIYEKMVDYAQTNHLELTGNAYEQGINDFAISCEEDYVTQIKIKIKE